MPRKNKGIHTSPAKAGIQNMPEDYPEKHKDKDNQMEGLMPIWKKSFENKERYKGLWNEEDFSREICEFFNYCESHGVKPAKAGLALWLATSKQQLWDWETHPEKYGFKSELIKQASLVMEQSYLGRAEQYPTANLFLLRTSHGYVDASKVDVTTNGQAIGSTPAEVDEAISKLGLDLKDSE